MQCVSNFLSIVNVRKMDPVTPIVLRTYHTHTHYHSTLWINTKISADQ